MKRSKTTGTTRSALISGNSEEILLYMWQGIVEE
jgi:hypothetical protein